MAINIRRSAASFAIYHILACSASYFSDLECTTYSRAVLHFMHAARPIIYAARLFLPTDSPGRARLIHELLLVVIFCFITRSNIVATRVRVIIDSPIESRAREVRVHTPANVRACFPPSQLSNARRASTSQRDT